MFEIRKANNLKLTFLTIFFTVLFFVSLSFYSNAQGTCLCDIRTYESSSCYGFNDEQDKLNQNMTALYGYDEADCLSNSTNFSCSPTGLNCTDFDRASGSCRYNSCVWMPDIGKVVTGVLSPNKVNAISGEAVSLSWTSHNADWCEIEDVTSNILYTSLPSSGSRSFFPTLDTVYKLTCSNTAESSAADSSVVVGLSKANECADSSDTTDGANLNLENIKDGTQSKEEECLALEDSINIDFDVDVVVEYGAEATISWNVTGPANTGCSAKGDGWNGPIGLSGSSISASLFDNSDFSITCSDKMEGLRVSKSQTTYVKPSVNIWTRSLVKEVREGLDFIDIYWNVLGPAVGCTASGYLGWDGVKNPGGGASQGPEKLGPFDKDTIFDLTCENINGDASSDKEVVVLSRDKK
jgi:hypothetical protein